MYKIYHNSQKVAQKTAGSAHNGQALAQLNPADISFEHTLGNGGFATVYKGSCKNPLYSASPETQPGNLSIAIKQYSGRDDDPVIEGQIQHGAVHPNIVRIYGFVKDSNCYNALVLELCNSGSLDDYLSVMDINNTKQDRESIAMDIAKGLVFLHEHCRIIHRDIKTGNILLHNTDKGLVAKISDFGFAKKLDINQYLYKGVANGSPAWAAPEAISSAETEEIYISSAVDIFAFGHIIHLLTSQFKTDPIQEVFNPPLMVLKFIREGRVENLPLDETYSTATTRTLIRRCHNTDPVKRPTAQAIIEEFEKGNTLFTSPT